jgi:hypothetical protein
MWPPVAADASRDVASCGELSHVHVCPKCQRAPPEFMLQFQARRIIRVGAIGPRAPPSSPLSQICRGREFLVTFPDEIRDYRISAMLWPADVL